jgi:2-polyprenyl-3-methyl-5-hydroxy-6-metoxy-1,4-benzoquinol methylase
MSTNLLRVAELNMDSVKTEVKLMKNCPLCSSENNHHVRTERCQFPDCAHPEVRAFNNMWIHLLECHNCGFAFTQEIPTSPTFFHNRYDNKFFDPKLEVESNRKHIIFEEIFSLLGRFNVREGKLLDVGSFAGKLLKYAKDKGFEPRGVEVNPKLAHHTKDILDIDVINGKIQEVDLPENEFDVITIIDVLEHLEDPRLIIEKLANALTVNGILIVKVPHYNMQLFKQRVANVLNVSPVGIFQSFGHINHFNQKSIEYLAKEQGLNLLHSYNARSEYWPSDRFINVIKNNFRDLYWNFSNLFLKVTGINLGLNTIYVLKKS